MTDSTGISKLSSVVLKVTGTASKENVATLVKKYSFYFYTQFYYPILYKSDMLCIACVVMQYSNLIPHYASSEIIVPSNQFETTAKLKKSVLKVFFSLPNEAYNKIKTIKPCTNPKTIILFPMSIIWEKIRTKFEIAVKYLI